MATTDALWAAWEGPGFEHLELRQEPGAVRADSLIIAVEDKGRPYRARYVVECDADWKVARARIEVLEDPGRVLAVRADGQGHWTAATGEALALDGCVDIDVYPSPFTNTLPISRLAEMPVGRPVALDVAWVVLPELTIQVARQEYTLLERGADGARWRFRGLDSDFVAELDVDGNGLVRDYPGIARRVL
ncbi:MAG TPA: putative glycolipid-binding domain-containing protein [Methylomirabilota bacterium]|nr:putative glycolipid-binding domain-containing protein [Methylomirabilota bacterium]